MTVVRVLFVAEYRVPHACFSLQWDHMLQSIDTTMVAHTSNLDSKLLSRIFQDHGIDCTSWQFINDTVIYDRYPEVQHWVFPDDYRTFWLRQQAIKLSYLDLLDADILLLHDPDTFMIEPYQCYQNGMLNLMTLMNTTQGSYANMFESITGIPRTSPHCFVTELSAVRKSDWQDLRVLLQARYPDKHWLDAIIDAVPGMPTVPPWGTGNEIKWFSEYEFLGNWSTHQGNVTYQAQRRFEYDALDKLAELDITKHNAVCDAVPDLRLSMQFDWNTLRVVDFDKYLGIVKRLCH